MDNWNVDKLSANDIDDLLIKISWTKHPDIIKKLLAYKSSSNAPVRSKTDAELKAEWKTEKLKNGTLCLVQYKGSDTTVSVPEKIGKEVPSFCLWTWRRATTIWKCRCRAAAIPSFGLRPKRKGTVTTPTVSLPSSLLSM